MPNEYELMPKYDARKSFYGKARVRVKGPVELLISYGTPVLWYDAETGRFHRTWDGGSSTTGRHVKEFSLQKRLSQPCDGAHGINKKEWNAMPVEPVPSL